MHAVDPGRIERDPSPGDDNQTSPAMIRLLAAAFLVLIFLLVYLVMAFWPVPQTGGDKAAWYDGVSLFGLQLRPIVPEVRLMWLVVFASSLGSCIHAVTSFASYVGNRTFHRSWLAWYVLRTPIGVALAMVFYFVIRGGLFSGNVGTEISPFGVAAIAGMVGLFSKQATDKLQEIFDNLFKTGRGMGDDARDDKLNTAENPAAAQSQKAAAGGSGQ